MRIPMGNPAGPCAGRDGAFGGSLELQAVNHISSAMGFPTARGTGIVWMNHGYGAGILCAPDQVLQNSHDPGAWRA
jgi:hypothetical protein